MRDILSNSPFRTIIERQAHASGLPAELVAALVLVESSGNPWTVRYEPGFYDRYMKIAEPKTIIPCTKETERRMCATSFGLLQIMGQVARERGFKGTYLTKLCDPETGIKYGCSHLAWTVVRLARKGITDLASICAAYNGGVGAVRAAGDYRNPEYPAKVLTVLGGSWEMQA